MSANLTTNVPTSPVSSELPISPMSMESLKEQQPELALFMMQMQQENVKLRAELDKLKQNQSSLYTNQQRIVTHITKKDKAADQAGKATGWMNNCGNFCSFLSCLPGVGCCCGIVGNCCKACANAPFCAQMCLETSALDERGPEAQEMPSNKKGVAKPTNGTPQIPQPEPVNLDSTSVSIPTPELPSI